jgi:enamine deaminase RidA (YjgF/YER057c/UK114 family)
VRNPMKKRQSVGSGGKYEEIVGYSRAVRVGNQVFVSGTSDLDSGPDVYTQTKKSIEKIGVALEKLGASLSDVVRTRVFVKSGIGWEGVAKAHREAFGKVMPASTMIAVEFLDPAVLVEIEADAVLGE